MRLLWSHRSDAASTSVTAPCTTRSTSAWASTGPASGTGSCCARRRRTKGRASASSPSSCTSSRRRSCATSTSWPHEGLVERRRDERDRRIARVYLTDPGRRRLQELHGVAEEVDVELRALLTEARDRGARQDPDAHPRALHREEGGTRCQPALTRSPADVAPGTGRGDPHRAAHQGLPGRHPRGRRARPLGAARRDLRAARPERRGQDDDRGDAHDARDPHERSRVRRRRRRRRAPDRGEAGDRRRAADEHARPLAHRLGEPLLPRSLLRDEREDGEGRGGPAARAVPARRPGRRRPCSRSPAAWRSG